MEKLDIEIIKGLATLGEKASAPECAYLDTEHLGPGLPKIVPLIFDRNTQEFKSLMSQIETYRHTPARRTGIAKTTTVESFIDLVNRHKDEDSAIFAVSDMPSPSLLAVIDYHKVNHEPQKMAHCVKYEFPLTNEFKKWMDGDGSDMEQAEFARFLEDQSAELATATGEEIETYESLFKAKLANPMDLVMLSRDLEIRVEHQVKRGERLQSGEQTVVFSEEHTNAKGESLTIPGAFILSVPAFMDGDPIRIPARLKYRIKGGSIHWFYNLYRADVWLRQEVQKVIAQVGQETKLPTFEGTPERT